MTTSSNDAENLSRIREILLGNQFEAIQAELEKINDDLGSSIKKLENQFLQQKEQFQAKVSDLQSEFSLQTEELSARNNTIDGEIKALRFSVEESLVKISSDFAAVAEELRKQDQSSIQQITRLSSQLSEMDQKMNRLLENTVDKKKLSAVFNQLAMELVKNAEDE